MNKEKILKLLEDVSNGKRSAAEALEDLRHMPFDDMDFAKVDSHRHLRNGFSEVIYCRGKTVDQVVSISKKMVEKGMNVLGTRAGEDMGRAVLSEFRHASYDQLSSTFAVINHEVKPLRGRIAILAAGTADLSVAEETKKTLQFFGAEVKTYYDVGVAGIHRLLAHMKDLDQHDVLVAVAGMEGALPSVLGGLVSRPIVAVPTSVGYGANFGGITPLLAMLNSCSEGITVVNIDNGFGAACAALRILKCIS
jgi:NCAIR mutase (PurE)-related protein